MNFHENKAFYINAGVIAVMMILGFVALYWVQNGGNSAAPSSPPASRNQKVELSPEIERVLSKKIMTIENLARDPIIQSEVIDLNVKNKNLSEADIKALDDKWRASKGVDETVKPYLTNRIALKLLEFQEKNPGFPEIFVTDKYGLNAGQTNKTSDFYQADEQWWISAYEHGAGKSYHGEIEFDDSAQSEAISIYVPVKDIVTGAVLGVIKAVLSVTAIKAAL